MKRFRATTKIRSLARGGVSLEKNDMVSEASFTADLLAALLKDGSVVEIDENNNEIGEAKPHKLVEKPEESKPEESAEIDATPAAVKFAEENGIDLAEVAGSGKDGRISLNDVKAVADA